MFSREWLFMEMDTGGGWLKSGVLLAWTGCFHFIGSWSRILLLIKRTLCLPTKYFFAWRAWLLLSDNYVIIRHPLSLRLSNLFPS